MAKDGISTHVFNVKNAYDKSAVGALIRYLKANEIDVLCTHDYRSHFIGFWALRNIKVKWVAFSRGWTKDDLKVRLFHIIDKIFIRFANHIVAVANSQKLKLIKLFVPEKKISIVHNAIDPDLFNDVTPIDLRANFGFPTNSVICISGG
ncbi:unnamed protein product, partial [marine sediment metagenome]